VGGPTIPGNTTFNGTTWALTASGQYIGKTSDPFQFADRSLSGNGTVIAKGNTLQKTDPWAPAGIMIRETTAPNSMFASVDYTPGNGVRFLTRTTTGANATSVAATGVALPLWVKLTRVGNSFAGYYSTNGTTWTQIGTTTTIAMSSNTLIGLVAC